MKTYPYIIEVSEEEIAEYQKMIDDFAKKLVKARIVEEQRRFLKLHIDQTIAELDEDLAEYYERTGKRLILPRYESKKVHNGN